MVQIAWEITCHPIILDLSVSPESLLATAKLLVVGTRQSARRDFTDASPPAKFQTVLVVVVNKIVVFVDHKSRESVWRDTVWRVCLDDAAAADPTMSVRNLRLRQQRGLPSACEKARSFSATSATCPGNSYISWNSHRYLDHHTKIVKLVLPRHRIGPFRARGDSSIFIRRVFAYIMNEGERKRDRVFFPFPYSSEPYGWSIYYKQKKKEKKT